MDIRNIEVGGKTWEVSKFSTEIQNIVAGLNECQEDSERLKEELQLVMNRGTREKAKIDALFFVLQTKLSELVQKELAEMEAAPNADFEGAANADAAPNSTH